MIFLKICDLTNKMERAHHIQVANVEKIHAKVDYNTFFCSRKTVYTFLFIVFGKFLPISGHISKQKMVSQRYYNMENSITKMSNLGSN